MKKTDKRLTVKAETVAVLTANLSLARGAGVARSNVIAFTCVSHGDTVCGTPQATQVGCVPPATHDCTVVCNGGSVNCTIA